MSTKSENPGNFQNFLKRIFLRPLGFRLDVQNRSYYRQGRCLAYFLRPLFSHVNMVLFIHDEDTLNQTNLQGDIVWTVEH